MSAEQSGQSGFFRDLQKDEVDFDGERFLTEVESRFESPALLEEVRWRLEVLDQLAQQREMEAEFEVLRDRLTQIFAQHGDERAIGQAVAELTTIAARDGTTLDLRHFLVPGRRVYNEGAYRVVLERKVENTQLHLASLAATYTDAQGTLRHLGKLMAGLAEKLRDDSVRTRTLKTIEDNIRALETFQGYENLKERFLRDWLHRFAGQSEQALAELGPEEIRRLIREHQRHQATRLVKAGVRPVESDPTEHLGIHDTLEGEFREEAFWKPAKAVARRDFNAWVLRVVQAVGLPNDRQYAFFQSQASPDAHLLFGLGLPSLAPGDEGEPLRLVPYLKPFTRKAGYLLEIRRRNIGDAEAYHHELRHYTLPFIFGFDQVTGLEVPRELRAFFNTHY